MNIFGWTIGDTAREREASPLRSLPWRVNVASRIGHEHARLSRNNQDGKATTAVCVGDTPFLIGVVCDGCSEGVHSEVGASQLATFLCNEIPMILSTGTPITEVTQSLYVRGVSYLRTLLCTTVSGPADRLVDYVSDHLLCTALGFVMDETHVVFFSAGDGVFVRGRYDRNAITDDVERIDQGNAPVYLGYHLIPRRYLKDPAMALPQSFETLVLPTSQLERFAVCSDGFNGVPTDVLWGQEDSFSLQCTLNVLGRKSAFPDDCTVIVVERDHALAGTSAEKG